MIAPFSHPDFAKNSRKIKGGEYACVVCGKGIPLHRGMAVRVGGGGSYFLEPDAPNDGPGEMGFHPIGPECLRKHPELKKWAR